MRRLHDAPLGGRRAERLRGAHAVDADARLPRGKPRAAGRHRSRSRARRRSVPARRCACAATASTPTATRSSSRGGSTARRARTPDLSSSVRRTAARRPSRSPQDARAGADDLADPAGDRRRDVPAHPVRPRDPQGRLKQRRARGLGPGLPDRKNPHDALRGSPAGGQAPIGERRHAEGRVLAGQDRLHRRLQGPRRRAAPRAPAQRRRRRPGRPRRATAASSGPSSSTRLDSYRYWERELGRDDLVARAVRRELHGRRAARRRGLHRRPLPDRHAPSSRSRQPRVTCYRVGHPHGRPAHPGAARLAPPPRASTSACSRRARSRRETRSSSSPPGPEQMTVAEVDALLYLPGHPRQQLLRALRIPALSPGWQASFRALLDGRAGRRQRRPGRDEPAAGVARLPRADGHRDRARERLGDLRSASRTPTAQPLPPRAPASTSRCASGPTTRRRSLLRNYSLSGPPGAGDYRITVKREEPTAPPAATCTPGSRVGDQLEVAAPRGTFILDRRRRARAADQRRHRRDAGARHAPRAGRRAVRAGDLVAARRAQQPRPALRRRGPRAARRRSRTSRTHVCYSRPGPDDLEGRDFDDAGRLTPSLLAELEPPRDAEAYLCGPAPFMEEISAGLAALGLDAVAHPHRAVRARARPDARASRPRRRGRPTRPRASPGPARRSSSRAATSRSRGATTTRACSSSPRRATSPSAGRAAPASATTARRRSSPARSTTTPTRSSRPPTAARSSAARAARRRGPRPVTAGSIRACASGGARERVTKL